MINAITRLFVLLGGVYAFYRYRYRIMNSVLGNPTIRRFFVSFAMNIPFLRDRFMRQAFRY